MTTELGKWFNRKADSYSPFRASSVDAYVCNEVRGYCGSYLNAVDDGEYESFPLTRAGVVRYAYNLYMETLPKGVRYQGKDHFQELAEKVVRGYEESGDFDGEWA